MIKIWHIQNKVIYWDGNLSKPDQILPTKTTQPTYHTIPNIPLKSFKPIGICIIYICPFHLRPYYLWPFYLCPYYKHSCYFCHYYLRHCYIQCYYLWLLYLWNYNFRYYFSAQLYNIGINRGYNMCISYEFIGTNDDWEWYKDF